MENTIDREYNGISRFLIGTRGIVNRDVGSQSPRDVDFEISRPLAHLLGLRRVIENWFFSIVL